MKTKLRSFFKMTSALAATLSLAACGTTPTTTPAPDVTAPPTTKSPHVSPSPEKKSPNPAPSAITKKETPAASPKPYPRDVCIVSDEDLESMGGAITQVYKGQEFKFCCKSCVKKFNADPEKYAAQLR